MCDKKKGWVGRHRKNIVHLAICAIIAIDVYVVKVGIDVPMFLLLSVICELGL